MNDGLRYQRSRWGFKFTTAECVRLLTSYIRCNVSYETIFAQFAEQGSHICTLSTHSSPVADLHRRGVQESFLKPQNGEAYVPFGDQEVPCMRRHRRTSLRAPRITIILTEYTHFSVVLFSPCKSVVELMPHPVLFVFKHCDFFE